MRASRVVLMGLGRGFLYSVNERQDEQKEKANIMLMTVIDRVSLWEDETLHICVRPGHV